MLLMGKPGPLFLPVSRHGDPPSWQTLTSQTRSGGCAPPERNVTLHAKDPQDVGAAFVRQRRVTYGRLTVDVRLVR